MAQTVSNAKVPGLCAHADNVINLKVKLSTSVVLGSIMSSMTAYGNVNSVMVAGEKPISTDAISATE